MGGHVQLRADALLLRGQSGQVADIVVQLHQHEVEGFAQLLDLVSGPQLNALGLELAGGGHASGELRQLADGLGHNVLDEQDVQRHRNAHDDGGNAQHGVEEGLEVGMHVVHIQNVLNLRDGLPVFVQNWRGGGVVIPVRVVRDGRRVNRYSVGVARPGVQVAL